MYKVISSEYASCLMREKRDGTLETVARLLKTPVDNLLIADTNRLVYKLNDERISFDSLEDLSTKTLKHDDIVKVYTPAHASYIHTEVMQANRSMLHLSTAKFMQNNPELRDSIALDYDGIADNMLEYVGTLEI